MWSLQETCDKAKVQMNRIKEVMDRTGSYHPEMEASDHAPATLYYGLSIADEREIREMLSRMSLAELLAKGGDITGVSYLVPTKLHDTLTAASGTTDIVPLISMEPIAAAWEGGNLDVPVLDDATFRPNKMGRGGAKAMQTPSFAAKPTITPVGFQITPVIATDLIEDNKYELIQWLIQKAAYGIGIYASTLALTVLATATDGVGDVNSVTGGTNETTPAQILEGVDAVGQDEKLANTMVITPEAWEHTVSGVKVGGDAGDIWRPLDAVGFPPIATGYHAKFHMLDTLFSFSTALHAAGDARGAVFTACKTIVFDRNNALATGRKRWMQLDDYADPITDLAGFSITCRQDSVTTYDDAVAVVTETT